MRSPSPSPLLLAQTPVQPVAPPGPFVVTDPRVLAVGGAILLALVLLLVWALRGRARRKKQAAAQKAGAPALPQQQPSFQVELPASEKELAQRREVEEARREAE